VKSSAVLERKDGITYNGANYLTKPQAIDMTDTAKPTLPDRLSGNARSPFHDEKVFEHEVGIRINGKERNDVEEYCISEGWIKVASNTAKDRRGQPLLLTIKGTVEAFYK